MTRTMTVSDSVVVAATPIEVYDQVSDPTLMGRWSPENLGAEVLGEQGKVGVGTVFIGRNKRGPATWVTRCVVTAADRGELFEFRVHAIGVRRPSVTAPNATWRYRFEAAPQGTLVTETWTDDRTRWPDRVADVFDWVVTGGDTFAEFQSKNISRTLRNLAAAFAES